VATISDKIITIRGTGTSTIIAKQGAAGNYLDGSANATFIVNTIRPTITNFFIQPHTFKDASFAITDPSSNSDGAFRYQIANTGIATISDNIITIVGTGTTIVTARQDASGNYKNNAVNTYFIVNPLRPTIINFSIPVKLYGDASFDLEDPSSNIQGTFNYESSNKGVADISNNKTVIMFSPGTTTITANLHIP